MWQYGNGMSGWGFPMMAGGLLVWVLIVVGVIALLRHVIRESAEPRPQHVGSTAEELLAERFARGDITEQEYRDRLDVLRPGPTSTGRRRPLLPPDRYCRAPRATYCVIGRWPGILRHSLGRLCPASMLCGRALWGHETGLPLRPCGGA